MYFFNVLWFLFTGSGSAAVLQWCINPESGSTEHSISRWCTVYYFLDRSGFISVILWLHTGEFWIMCQSGWQGLCEHTDCVHTFVQDRIWQRELLVRSISSTLLPFPQINRSPALWLSYLLGLRRLIWRSEFDHWAHWPTGLVYIFGAGQLTWIRNWNLEQTTGARD